MRVVVCCRHVHRCARFGRRQFDCDRVAVGPCRASVPFPGVEPYIETARAGGECLGRDLQRPLQSCVGVVIEARKTQEEHADPRDLEGCERVYRSGPSLVLECRVAQGSEPAGVAVTGPVSGLLDDQSGLPDDGLGAGRRAEGQQQRCCCDGSLHFSQVSVRSCFSVLSQGAHSLLLLYRSSQEQRSEPRFLPPGSSLPRRRFATPSEASLRSVSRLGSP